MMQQVQPKSAATRADATTVRSSSWPIRRVGTMLSTSLSDREPVSTVSQRLGHTSEVITLGVYAHVLPGDQKRAAARFAELVGEA